VYTVSQLAEILNLETENQARNRINALRDQLQGHLRRGPNNQLLVTEAGLDLLHSLQALCETGYILKDAAALVRHEQDAHDVSLRSPCSAASPYQTKPGGTGKLAGEEQTDPAGWTTLVQYLAEQVRTLEARVAALEARAGRPDGQTPWWERWQ